MKLRVLIAEDEPVCREHLRHLLESEPLVEIVAECATGKEALLAIQQTRPDIVLLDVRLPELDGFSIVQQLGPNPPEIIVVTGSEKFALQAFEMHAADYLLKPFDRARLHKALLHVRDRIRHGSGQTPPKAPEPAPKPAQPLERITIKSQGRITIVKTADIDWMVAADNYVELHVGAATHLLRSTVADLEKRLSKHLFARISRSLLVNLDRVQEIRPATHGDYVVILRNGTRLRGTRNFRANLSDLLNSRRSSTSP